MDKASIVKDAIDYVQELHDQERRVRAEILELESGKLSNNAICDSEEEIPALLRSKKKKIDQSFDSGESRASPIEDLEVSPLRFCHYFLSFFLINFL